VLDGEIQDAGEIAADASEASYIDEGKIYDKYPLAQKR
jgi:hypothetical protein